MADNVNKSLAEGFWWDQMEGKGQMSVSKTRGGPPKWMVYFMENPIKMDDLGVPLFLETPK